MSRPHVNGWLKRVAISLSILVALGTLGVQVDSRYAKAGEVDKKVIEIHRSQLRLERRVLDRELYEMEALRRTRGWLSLAEADRLRQLQRDMEDVTNTLRGLPAR